MRKLTEKEKALCPKGFDRYYVSSNNNTSFINSTTGDCATTNHTKPNELKYSKIPYVDETLIKLTGSVEDKTIIGFDLAKPGEDKSIEMVSAIVDDYFKTDYQSNFTVKVEESLTEAMIQGVGYITLNIETDL